jgi:hypothetical protein
MNAEYQRALMRLVLAEKQLSQFDAYRDEKNIAHERLLRKLRGDVEKADSDLRWVESRLNG